jgi:hypothetical protein
MVNGKDLFSTLYSLISNLFLLTTEYRLLDTEH